MDLFFSQNLETLISIASFFHVSLDDLAGLSDLKQQIRQNDLSSNELEHLNRYHQLSDIDREKINNYRNSLDFEGLVALI